MSGRRAWLLTVVLGLVAAAPVAVPILTGSPRAHAVGETLTVDPKCVATGTAISLTFDGTGFLDDSTVRIFDEHQNNKQVAIAGTNKSGDFYDVKTQPGSIPAKPTGYYWFNAGDPNVGQASKAIKVPCPTLSISPGCGPVATTPSETYDIKVTGANWPPVLADVPSTINFAFAGQPLNQYANADQYGAFTITLKVPRRPAGNYQLQASEARDGNVVTANFLVPCLQIATTTTTTLPATTTTVTTAPPPVVGPAPACTVAPPVGPPGFVTQASCQNFPANATASLRWSPGLGTTTAKVGGDGRFTVPVLILPNDQLGPRQLIAEAPGVSVKVPFLVVPPTVTPSGGDVATRRLAPQFVLRQ